MSGDVKIAIQWYRCSCGFEGEMSGPRSEIVHWLVQNHLLHKGSDHKMIVKEIGSESVASSSPTCIWCGSREKLVRDLENESWVCQEHTRKGPTA